MIVQVDSKRDQHEICIKMFHDEKKLGAGMISQYHSRPDYISGTLFLLRFQLFDLALKSFQLGFPLASIAGGVERIGFQFEAVDAVLVETVIRRNLEQHGNGFHVIFQAKLFFQVLDELLIEGIDHNRVLLCGLASGNGIGGDGGGGGGVNGLVHSLAFYTPRSSAGVAGASPCDWRREENDTGILFRQARDERFLRFFFVG